MRDKPDFSVGSGGWVDPNFLPQSLCDELLLHLQKSPLTSEQKAALIKFANDMAQMVMDGDLEPAQATRGQIERVASDARRLLSSMNQLSASARDALHAHVAYLVLGSAPPVGLEEPIKDVLKHPQHTLLSNVWDWVEALEKSAEYATEKITPDTTSKPNLLRARGYVAMIAEHVQRMTGACPPKDPASWFAVFVVRLGEHLGMPIGPRVVASGIDAIR